MAKFQIKINIMLILSIATAATEAAAVASASVSASLRVAGFQTISPPTNLALTFAPALPLLAPGRRQLGAVTYLPRLP